MKAQTRRFKWWQKPGGDPLESMNQAQFWSTILTRLVSLLIQACSSMLLCPDCPSWHLFSLRIRSAASSLSPLSLTTLQTSLIVAKSQFNQRWCVGRPHAMEEHSKSSQHVEQLIARERWRRRPTDWTREDDAAGEELRCRRQTQRGACQTHKS